ncbi:MAG: 30S ribosomal protein S6 [Planctomycetota bacterium]
MTTRARTYECMCLLDNREVRKGWEPLKEAVAGLFSKHDCKVLSSRRWEERRLAYPINGQNRGTYLLVYFTSDTQVMPGLRRELEFHEPMLRYMILDCDEVPEEAHQPEEEFDVNAIPEDDAPDVEEEPEEEKAEEAKSEEAKPEGEAAEGGEAAKAEEGTAAEGTAAEGKPEESAESGSEEAKQ